MLLLNEYLDGLVQLHVCHFSKGSEVLSQFLQSVIDGTLDLHGDLLSELSLLLRMSLNNFIVVSFSLFCPLLESLLINVSVPGILKGILDLISDRIFLPIRIPIFGCAVCCGLFVASFLQHITAIEDIIKIERLARHFEAP